MKNISMLHGKWLLINLTIFLSTPTCAASKATWDTLIDGIKRADLATVKTIVPAQIKPTDTTALHNRTPLQIAQYELTKAPFLPAHQKALRSIVLYLQTQEKGATVRSASAARKVVVKKGAPVRKPAPPKKVPAKPGPLARKPAARVAPKPAPKPAPRKPVARPAPKPVARKVVVKPVVPRKPVAKPVPKRVAPVRKPVPLKKAPAKPKPAARVVPKPAPKPVVRKPVARPAPKPVARKVVVKPAPKLVPPAPVAPVRGVPKVAVLPKAAPVVPKLAKGAVPVGLSKAALWNALINAIKLGRLDFVKRAVPAQIKPDETTTGGRTPLQIARYEFANAPTVAQHNALKAIVDYLQSLNPAPLVPAVPAPAAPGILAFYDQHKPYYEFTNFYPLSSLILAGLAWPTTEHFFQAMKFQDPVLLAKVHQDRTPREAFNFAQKYKTHINPEWHKVPRVPFVADLANLYLKEQVMMHALRAKFAQDPLKTLLLNTDNAYLIEYSPYDTYWGWYPGKLDPMTGKEGLNMLGKMLMHVRAELRAGRHLPFDTSVRKPEAQPGPIPY
jgi:ribA/ribD-fused uncharacterized protein